MLLSLIISSNQTFASEYLFAIDSVSSQNIITETYTSPNDNIVPATNPYETGQFIHTDWRSEGDKLSTLDTTSGLEWLKLPETLGKSISEVEGLLGAGQQYEGWRIPTSDEVIDYVWRVYDGSRNEQFNREAVRLTIRASNINDPLFTAGWGYLGRTLNGSYVKLSNGVIKKMVDGVGHTATFTAQDSTQYNTDRLFLGNSVYPNLTRSNSNDGVFLVSDGGATLSSKENPAINIAQ